MNENKKYTKKIQPIVSVIIPIYMVELYLSKCIDSVLQQTYLNLEIILVNDGSKDRCPNICDDYAKKDERIRVIHKENGGLSDARNFGLEVATGEYIIFIDSDDFIEFNMIEIMMNKILDFDVIACGYFIEYKNHSEKKELFEAEYNAKQGIVDLIYKDNMNSYAWNKLYKKSLFQEIRYPKGILYEDILTTYKILLKCNKIKTIKEPLYHYQIRNDSITGQNKASSMDVVDASIMQAQEITSYYPDIADLCAFSVLLQLRRLYMQNYHYADRQLCKPCIKISKEYLKKVIFGVNISTLEKLKCFIFCLFPKLTALFKRKQYTAE